MSGRAAEELLPLIDAAQRVAGVVAARGRGDADGARNLLTSFEDREQLAAGSLLVAELSLGMLRQETGSSLDALVRDLCLQLETAADRLR